MAAELILTGVIRLVEVSGGFQPCLIEVNGYPLDVLLARHFGVESLDASRGHALCDEEVDLGVLHLRIGPGPAPRGSEQHAH